MPSFAQGERSRFWRSLNSRPFPYQGSALPLRYGDVSMRAAGKTWNIPAVCHGVHLIEREVVDVLGATTRCLCPGRQGRAVAPLRRGAWRRPYWLTISQVRIRLSARRLTFPSGSALVGWRDAMLCGRPWSPMKSAFCSRMAQGLISAERSSCPSNARSRESPRSLPAAKPSPLR